MRLLLVVLATIQICLGAWVFFRCAYGRAGLHYFCVDMELLSEVADESRWKAIKGDQPVPSAEQIRRSADLFTGNHIDRITFGVPLVCLINCIVLIGLAIVVPRRMKPLP